MCRSRSRITQHLLKIVTYLDLDGLDGLRVLELDGPFQDASATIFGQCGIVLLATEPEHNSASPGVLHKVPLWSVNPRSRREEVLVVSWCEVVRRQTSGRHCFLGNDGYDWAKRIVVVYKLQTRAQKTRSEVGDGGMRRRAEDVLEHMHHPLRPAWAVSERMDALLRLLRRSYNNRLPLVCGYKSCPSISAA